MIYMINFSSFDWIIFVTLFAKKRITLLTFKSQVPEIAQFPQIPEMSHGVYPFT